MSLICYHASHEQFSPSHLLDLVIAAEEAAFDGIHSSDHFHPWSERQGHSGFAFSWIAAAMQATSLPFSMVCAPGQRYHPAIAAQAIATLAQMFPGRINIELGSGEALNEMITGEEWPEKKIRNERLLQCADVIRRLLKGEEVNSTGHITVRDAKLYTLPAEMPLLLCAAISTETSQWAGGWADGLLTTADKELEDTLTKIKQFKENGGAGKPVYLQFAFSYARSLHIAKDGAYQQWRSNILPREKLASLHTVKQFDEAGKNTTMEEVLEVIPVFTDIKELRRKVEEFESTGADRIILHNINRLHQEFIDDYKTICNK